MIVNIQRQNYLEQDNVKDVFTVLLQVVFMNSIIQI